MCKHILNAQVSVRAPCCKRWFDCPECHAEASNHALLKMHELVMACKACKKVFRKDSREMNDESDEYCPHCDNHYVIQAVEPQGLGEINATELLKQMQENPNMYNDHRMKQKFVDFDAEMEALLQQ